jgi:hypothetical protein
VRLGTALGGGLGASRRGATHCDEHLPRDPHHVGAGHVLVALHFTLRPLLDWRAGVDFLVIGVLMVAVRVRPGDGGHRRAAARRGG